MKKFTKVISVLLVMTLLFAMAAISTMAAEPASITVLSAPAKTVYIDGVDNWENELWCDPTGMVIEVTFDDGSTEEIIVDEYSYVDMYVYDYVIGENEATVDFYGTDDYDAYLTTTVTVEVIECPVASVEITKMPEKTEYTMDDVLTAENLTFDKLYAAAPEIFDEMAAELGLSYEELKEFYESDPEYLQLFTEFLFEEYDAHLLIDTTGMEIVVTFADGSTQTLTDEDNYAVYNGAEIPVYLEQVSPTVEEGENEFIIIVGDAMASFTVTVVGEEDNNDNNDKPIETPDKTPATPEQKPTDDLKNPEIPNTDGGVSIATATVLALLSGCGIALIPSRKRK